MGKTTEPIVASIKPSTTTGSMQQTIENIKAFLFTFNNHAFTMKQIVGAIEHHYKTDDIARNSLRVWIDAGLVQGVVSTVGRPYTPPTRYYLDWAKRNRR